MATPASEKGSFQHSFAGKRILITGGGQGIGRAIVKRFYDEGAEVFVIEKNASLVEQLRKDFPKIRAEEGDVAQWKETQKIIDDFGPIDHLVNNAGVVTIKDFVDVSEKEVDWIFGVNLKGVLCVSQAVAKGMIANKIHGTIVNVASLAGHIASDGTSLYSTSKGGVIMITKSLARELGKYNIRCNCISPTAVNTELYRAHKDFLPPLDDPKNILGRQPLAGQTVLEETEVVDGIAFLLSPLSSMMTGADLVVDGGILAC